jgi:hypothetical protein
MSPREEVDAVFSGLVGDPSEAGLEALQRTYPEMATAALAYLRDRYVGGVQPTEEWESLPTFRTALSVILGTGGEAASAGLVAIALEVGHPAVLRPLADVVTGVMSPDELARALINALGPDCAPRARANARELAYYTFEAMASEYSPSRDLDTQLSERLNA